MFRAQQQAAEAVYARLQEVAALLADIRKEANALQRTDELKQLLEREERWLSEARQTVVQVQRWRENGAHLFWRGVVRWVIAAVFAIGAAAAAGGSYAALTKPYEREMERLRNEAAFGKFVEQRALKMSSAERRELDVLLRWPRTPNLKSQVEGKR
jgi:hypothetical protein